KTFSTMTDFGNGTFSSGTSKICTGKFNNAIDRPWLASYGSRVYIVYNAGTGAGGTAIDVSADGGLTFSHKLAVPSSECDCGGSSTPLTVDPSDGALYIPYVTWGSTSLKVAVSTDGGSTFNYHTIVQMPSMNTSAFALGGFPSIAIDKEGNLYAVWSDNSAGNYNVYMSVSKDKGVSWGTPIKVNAQPGQHFKPWAVAGNAGNVAVAWYGTNDSGTSPWNAPNARWYVHVSVSLDALANQPSFQESTVANVPFHIGSICSHTYTCADTNDSNGEHKLADFFQITIDKDGRLNVVWTDTAQYNGTTAHIFFSRQISGPNILGKSTSMTSNQSTSSTTQTITSATTSGSSLMSSITTIYTQQPQQPQNNGILMFALVIIIVLIIAVAYFYRLSHKTF
ncbi:MAG: exo-alpha-sialidase, partial [Candidatus Micrarchaeota archaeon]|nr:exo-alpha-sialidase [Candidatus Micrarchaeota archaeon]